MKKIISILIVLCMFFIFSIPAFATEPPKIILDSRDAVLKINSYYDIEKTRFYGSGTGFLVETIEGVSAIVCTNWHVVTNLDEDSAVYGQALPSVNIVSNRDIEISAEIIFASEKADFAILKLQNPIYNRRPLVLADSNTLKGSETVYALGFPDIVDGFNDNSAYRPENVSITSGNISKITSLNNIPMIQHTAIIDSGSSGSPLITEGGAVVGINTIMATDHEKAPSIFYAVQINEVRNALDDMSTSPHPNGQLETPPEPCHEAFVIGSVLFFILTVAALVVFIVFMKKSK